MRENINERGHMSVCSRAAQNSLFWAQPGFLLTATTSARCLRINELRVYGSPVRPASATAPLSLPSGKHKLTSAGRSPDDAFFCLIFRFLHTKLKKIPPECLHWTVSDSREEWKSTAALRGWHFRLDFRSHDAPLPLRFLSF